VALLGARDGQSRTEGEQLLVAKAGADKADPLIRYVVDDEFGDVAHKDKSFADRVMFWRDGQEATPAATAAAADNVPAPVDAQTEAERLKNLTGGEAVVIRRGRAPGESGFDSLPRACGPGTSPPAAAPTPRPGTARS
jgi:hypothetical protein